MGAGGTSFAAPAFAGVMALINQKTGERQGNANEVLYSLARLEFGSAKNPLSSGLSACSSDLGENVGASCIFHDVVTGDNTVPCDHDSPNCSLKNVSSGLGVTTGYYATAGYDPASGLGSVNVSNLVTGWGQIAPAAASQTTLALTPTSGVYGDTYAFTINVAAKDGAGTPTGSVLVLSDNSQLVAVDLVKGSASGSLRQIGGGRHSVIARYVGDDSFGPSASSAVDVNVTPAASASTLTIYEVNPYTGAKTKSNAVHYGAKIVADVLVAGVTGLTKPSGSVQFSGAASQSAPLDDQGDAAIVLTAPAIGESASIAASYSGDTNYQASQAAAQSYSVTKAATTVRVSPSTSYQIGDGTLTLSVIASTYSSGVAPTGKFDLQLNGASIAEVVGAPSVDAVTGGAASVAVFSVSASALKVGGNSIVVSYAGDANYAPAASAALSIGYGATAPVSAVVLSATPTTATQQQSVQLKAAVKFGDLSATAGSVTFFDNGVAIGEKQIIRTAASDALGTAIFVLRPGVGQHSYTARFNGVGSILAANSNAVAVSISGQFLTNVSLTATTNDLHASRYDFVAEVTSYGFTPPSGSLAIDENSTVATLATFTVDPQASSYGLDNPSLFTFNYFVPALNVVDLNNDGVPDLVTREVYSDDHLNVLLGKGDGSFADPVTYAANNQAMYGDLIVSGDFNGDGFQDIATLNSIAGQIGVYLGNGDGTLQTPIPVNTGQASPAYLHVADFDHDGILDFVTISPTDGSLAFYKGRGDGGFADPTLTTIGGSPNKPVFGDVNNDGNLDLIYRDDTECPPCFMSLSAMARADLRLSQTPSA